MKTVGPGVREIRITDDTGEYRSIYLATLEDAVHVYHVFQKKTSKTPQRDIDLARKRYDQHMQSLRGRK